MARKPLAKFIFGAAHIDPRYINGRPKKAHPVRVKPKKRDVIASSNGAAKAGYTLYHVVFIMVLVKLRLEWSLGVKAYAQSHRRPALRVQPRCRRPITAAPPPVSSMSHPCGTAS